MRFQLQSRHRIALFLVVILLSLVGASCGEDQIKAVATNVDRVAVLIQSGREIRDELFLQGVIDRDDAYKVTVALHKVNSALKTFNNRARTYQTAGQLDPEGKALLKKLAEDIAGAATELISNGTFGVKNADAQARINAAIGAIRQATLAIVDTVGALKAKPPVQQQESSLLALIPLLLAGLRQLMTFVARERARTGKTAAEIFAEAGAQVDANEIALLDDLTRYAPEAGPAEAKQ